MAREGKYAGGRPDMLPFLPAGAHTALDVGSGSGVFGAQLVARAPRLEVWAVEPDPGGAAAAERAGCYAKVVVGAFPPPSGHLPERFFDCIFFNDVLEHMAEPGDALEAASALLSDDGVLVASIPNVRCIDVVKPLVLDGEWRYEDYGLLDRTHLRFFTRRSILRLFEEHGYAVDSVEGMHARRDAKVRVVRRLLGRRVDDFLVQQYAVVARPRRPMRSGRVTGTEAPEH